MLSIINRKLWKFEKESWLFLCFIGCLYFHWPYGLSKLSAQLVINYSDTTRHNMQKDIPYTVKFYRTNSVNSVYCFLKICQVLLYRSISGRQFLHSQQRGTYYKVHCHYKIRQYVSKKPQILSLKEPWSPVATASRVSPTGTVTCLSRGPGTSSHSSSRSFLFL